MKKYLLLVLSLLFCLTGCNNKSDNLAYENSYNTSRTISTDNSANNNNLDNTMNNSNTNQTVTNDESVESEISSFSTKIYTPNDKARQKNIQITCSKLNGTIVKPGETFSFCNTVGRATPEEGYQKADIFDKDGNVTKGYGGGNCQISSTLYNAVLALPNLSVVERHKHSKKVYYVPEGKDAAVAYGSIDFKFKNDYDYNIKIYASSDTNNINVKIVKL